jgi:hypothetical protein
MEVSATPARMTLSSGMNPEHRPGSRPWLFLLDDEVQPHVLDAQEPKLVVWSSIWPTTPDEVIRFELAPDGLSGTNLTWTLTSPVELPPNVVGHQRLASVV